VRSGAYLPCADLAEATLVGRNGHIMANRGNGADIADAIAIGVGLVGIAGGGAVVTNVPNAIAVGILLIGVADLWAIVAVVKKPSPSVSRAEPLRSNHPSPRRRRRILPSPPRPAHPG